MNHIFIVNKRSLFLIPGIFLSSLLISQPPSSVKIASDQRGHYLDITAFGSIKRWCKTTDQAGAFSTYRKFNQSVSADSADIGVCWWYARDIQSVEIVYRHGAGDKSAGLPILQYWHHTWPEVPPVMPTIEDQEDDPWQGSSITAAVNAERDANRLIYTFKPLAEKENDHAVFLPGSITYRRTLKIRLLYPQKHPDISAIHIFSASREKSSSIRIELGCDQNNPSSFKGSLEIFNGRLKNISPWNWDHQDKKTGTNSWTLALNRKPKGIIAEIYSARVTLPGSNDETVVTLRSPQGTFSFSLNDLEKGPVYIPHFNAYITTSDDPLSFSKANLVKGKTIRQRIETQPEQSYDRARTEIPHLDPVHDQQGNRIYLPLASDANWQKFAVQWGGNIFIDKLLTKAQGKELARCNWNGDALAWKIGTGLRPNFSRTEENCEMSLLNDYLPVIYSRWRQDSLNYEEEAFTTLLSGPLSPSDPERSEQTAAILLVKLTVSNPLLHGYTSNVWLSGNQALNNLTVEDNFLFDQIAGKKYLRCYMLPPAKGLSVLTSDSSKCNRSVHHQMQLDGNSSAVFYFYFPFVGDLNAADSKKIAALDFDAEKARVETYWRNLVTKQVVYRVPERKFDEMEKAVIPHIRMSATKDPRSGLYLVPASSLGYGVFANEAIFQTMLLDRLGDFSGASDYLNTFMELQGSRKLPGDFTGDQKDVFYGVKIDSVYDLTFNGYNMHHGAVLWALASHYLYSADREWLLKAAPHMIRAANWIIDQRSQTKERDEKGNKVDQYGLLPAGILEDPTDWQYWYAVNAYACLGLETMVKAFTKAGLPQAAFYQAEAAAYHADIRRSIENAIELSPVIRLRNNEYVPYVPTRPYQRFRYFGSKKSAYYDRYLKGIYPNLRLSAIREALYGPIVLIKTGMIDADEPMADWILNDWEDNLTLSTSLNLNTHGWVDDDYWFSRGGMVFQANLQNPVDTYLKRRETKSALRVLYNSFVSCLYPDVNAQTEEYRMWGHGSGPFYKIPDEARVINQVCDLLVMQKKDELWLGAGIPQRWLEPGQKVELINAHTEYGTISFSLGAGKSTESIEADVDLPSSACSRILLFVHAPFQKPIQSVRLNGKDWKDWDAGKESVTVPQSDKHIHMTIFY